MGGGGYMSRITLLNINRKENYFYAHPSSTFSGIPKRFVIPPNEIISATSTDIETRGFLFLIIFIRFASKLLENDPVS
jgi:hypothetical protein